VELTVKRDDNLFVIQLQKIDAYFSTFVALAVVDLGLKFSFAMPPPESYYTNL
jgi:hypothetical protein